MQVHAFRGPERVFGFTTDPSGSNLPSRYGPWTPFKTLELREGERVPGVDVTECLRDIGAHGMHITDAHVRITEQALRESDNVAK